VALPVAQDLKNYLRVQTTAEDAAIAGILATAAAYARTYLDRPITAKARTYTIEDPRASAFGGSRLSGNPTRTPFLRIPDTPVDTTQPITITDRTGLVLDPTTYRVDGRTGVVRSGGASTVYAGNGFGAYPFTVVATTGLAVLDEYALEIEPAISAAILDIGADLYQRRNPAATDENDGAGGSIRYGRTEETIPARAIALLAPYRRPPL
jgi:hypothetical protein